LVQLAANTLERNSGIRFTPEVYAALRRFFGERLRSALITEGFATRHVDAVLTLTDSPVAARARAKAIALVPDETCKVFKRIANILDQSREVGIKYPLFGLDERLFEAQVERDLWREWSARRHRIGVALDAGEYEVAFRELAELGPSVSAFLAEREKGGVMVLDRSREDVSGNRLALLENIRDPYAQIVDFRLLGGAS
jgi:glycyl-tRNA synthetase beta subunit